MIYNVIVMCVCVCVAGWKLSLVSMPIHTNYLIVLPPCSPHAIFCYIFFRCYTNNFSSIESYEFSANIFECVEHIQLNFVTLKKNLI